MDAFYTSLIKTFKNEVKSRDGTITVIGTSACDTFVKGLKNGSANFDTLDVIVGNQVSLATVLQHRVF